MAGTVRAGGRPEDPAEPRCLDVDCERGTGGPGRPSASRSWAKTSAASYPPVVWPSLAWTLLITSAAVLVSGSTAVVAVIHR